MDKNITIEINGKEITIIKNDSVNYVCLTQIVDSYSGGNGNGTIDKWKSNKNTLEYLGAWESFENPVFNYPEFGVINSSYLFQTFRIRLNPSNSMDLKPVTYAKIKLPF